MKLHPFLIHAIYLRQHPDDFMEESDGTIYWYDVRTNKYMYYKPNNKLRKGPYEARGLQCYWNCFVREIEFVRAFEKDTNGRYFSTDTFW